MTHPPQGNKSPTERYTLKPMGHFFPKARTILKGESLDPHLWPKIGVDFSPMKETVRCESKPMAE
jgi:hypothetical protein